MTELLREKQRAVRRRPLSAVLLLIAIVGVIAVAGSGVASTLTATCTTNGTLDATAVNGGQSNFEIDAAVVGGTVKKPVVTAGANLTLDGGSPCIDWTTSAAGNGGNDSLTSGVLVKPDKASGSGDDSFTAGTSENDTTPTISTGSIPPNKSDLQDFGIYRESNATGKFLNLFWSRINAPSGTVDMDFELNQNVCDGTSTTCSNNGSGQFILPLRKNGDRLITYDLANGGTNPTISIYTWSGSASSGSWTNGTVISGASHEALGSINFSPIALADGGGLGAKDALTFGEVSISYKALFGSSGTSGCGSFGSVFLKSRSSNTFTDEMKDFVAPEAVQITNCTTITTSATSSVTIGSNISDTATLSGATGNATGGITFKLYGPFTGNDPTQDTCVDPATGVTGNLVTTLGPIAIGSPNASGNYVVSSGNYAPTAVGRYQWVASYGGDSKNNSAPSACKDSGEASVVNPAATTLATAQSAYPNDTATVTSALKGFTGNVTFTAFVAGGGNTALANCTSNNGTGQLDSETVGLGAGDGTSGGGLYSKSVGTSNTTHAVPPGTTVYWRVSYEGDGTHVGRHSTCVENTVLTFNDDSGPGAPGP
jgi:hypothetical protein